jgi:hypothetical protein
VSAKELTNLVTKAEKWRGSKGERRKVVVKDNVFTSVDEEDEVRCSFRSKLL